LRGAWSLIIEQQDPLSKQKPVPLVFPLRLFLPALFPNMTASEAFCFPRPDSP